MNLTRLFIARPALVFVFMALVAIFGVYSCATLIQEQFPNVDLPVIAVEFSYIGASSTEMRDAIVRPIEDAISGAPNLDYLKSTIQQGQASIAATFDLTSDKNTDLVEVQRRVQSAQSELPIDVRSPIIGTFDPSQSIVTTLVATSRTLPTYGLASLVTHDIVPFLEQVPGISNVQITGAVTPALVTTIDPQRLASTNATLTDVINAISTSNVRSPGGYATAFGKETSIDVRGDITGPDSVSALLLPNITLPASTTTQAWTTAPQLLRIADVASVESGFEPPRNYAFYRSQPAITLDILKATGASEVTASQSVIAALPALHRAFPQVDFAVSTIQATNTEQQLQGVVRSLLEGIFLTAIVMIFFLRSWRNAIVVMLAIPVSLGITFGTMKLANFTIDVVSLLAMTLIIGILVDDSIVVLENTERHREQGDEPKQAALLGRTEIGLAAVVITLVDVVVFLPIAFLPGTVGKFLNEFGLVVVVATLSSLLVSFTITPALAGNWSLLSRWKPPAIIDGFTRGFERLRSWYANRALPWALKHPKLVTFVCFASMIGAIALLPLGLVGFEFIPSVDRGQLAIQLTFPAGTAIDTTRDRTVRVERAIDAIGADLDNETAIAGGTVSPFGGIINEGCVAQINVNLSPQRHHSTEYWTAYFRTKLPRLVPMAQISVIPATGSNGGIEQPIDYVVSASGNTDPSAAARRVAALLASTPGATNVTNGAANLSPQIEVHFNRDAARVLNVGIADAAKAIRSAFGGNTITQYIAPNGLEDVEIIYPSDQRNELTTLAAIPLRSNTGKIVHVGDFATFVFEPAPAVITRQDRHTIITIGANVAPGFIQSNVTQAFTARLASLHLPPDISVGTNSGGSQQNLKDTLQGITFALALAFTLTYLLMLALFNSYRAPAIILFAVPVAIVGALGSLALTHQTLNLFSMIGTVLLIGLVSKNGILLVDFANRARAEGLDRVQAICQAGTVRFRPIVMTTLSMIAGMLPLALAIDPGSDSRRALGIVVIGGLSSSLVLTLLLVPIMYVTLSPKRLIPPDH